MIFSISDKAAAAILKQAQAKERPPKLRIGIRGGGCSGYSYIFEWAEKEKDTDKIFKQGGSQVLIDPKSLIYLNGAELDFVTTLMEYGFTIINPNSTGSCGCGSSVNF